MILLSLTLTSAVSSHDAGVREVAALSARLAYVLTCLSLSWGVLVSTGWVSRVAGRQATRSSHMVFATLALGFGTVHAAAFLFLTGEQFSLTRLLVPLLGGSAVRQALGIAGAELMLAIAVSTLTQRFIGYRRWLRLHRTAYVAVGMVVLHSFFGAAANGHLALVWLAGLSFAVPTAVLAALRFVPSRVFAEAGLLEEDL